MRCMCAPALTSMCSAGQCHRCCPISAAAVCCRADFQGGTVNIACSRPSDEGWPAGGFFLIDSYQAPNCSSPTRATATFTTATAIEIVRPRLATRGGPGENASVCPGASSASWVYTYSATNPVQFSASGDNGVTCTPSATTLGEFMCISLALACTVSASLALMCLCPCMVQRTFLVTFRTVPVPDFFVKQRAHALCKCATSAIKAVCVCAFNMLPPAPSLPPAAPTTAGNVTLTCVRPDGGWPSVGFSVSADANMPEPRCSGYGQGSVVRVAVRQDAPVSVVTVVPVATAPVVCTGATTANLTFAVGSNLTIGTLSLAVTSSSGVWCSAPATGVRTEVVY